MTIENSRKAHYIKPLGLLYLGISIVISNEFIASMRLICERIGAFLVVFFSKIATNLSIVL